MILDFYGITTFTPCFPGILEVSNEFFGDRVVKMAADFLSCCAEVDDRVDVVEDEGAVNVDTNGPELGAEWRAWNL